MTGTIGTMLGSSKESEGKCPVFYFMTRSCWGKVISFHRVTIVRVKVQQALDVSNKYHLSVTWMMLEWHLTFELCLKQLHRSQWTDNASSRVTFDTENRCTD